MKNILLIHNPGAGNEEHTKKSLTRLLEKGGFSCRYCSTDDEGWEHFDRHADLIVVAGGDGTIKKVATALLDQKPATAPPIAVLPLGTANNIAQSLNITGRPDDIIRSWQEGKVTPIDVGKLNGSVAPTIFIESFGYGVFPFLMAEMQNKGKEAIEEKDEKKQEALRLLHKIVTAYEPRQCELEIDGKTLSGVFLLAEIMNMQSIGPNLLLSPNSDPGDGELEVILIPGEEQAKFAAYIESKINGEEPTYIFPTIKARDVNIKWKGTHVHVDDEILKLDEDAAVHISIEKNALSFLV